MVGFILELIFKEDEDIKVKVILGVIVSIGVVVIFGVFIMYDFCYISLSDLMILWEVIEKRLRLVVEVDFVICLYNLRSKGRSEYLSKVFKIMGEFKSGDIFVGVVKDVGREKEEKFVCIFENMDFEKVDMIIMVIIGNKFIYINGELMIILRGYIV